MSKQSRTKMARDALEKAPKTKKSWTRNVEFEKELPSVSSFLTVRNDAMPWMARHSTPVSNTGSKILMEPGRGIPRNLSPIKRRTEKIPEPETPKEKRMKQEDDENMKDFRMEDQDKLVQEYIRLCKTVNDNIIAIWDNDDQLAKQDRQIEKLMLSSSELADEDSRWKRKCRELTKIKDSSKAEAQRQRVLHKTNLIEAQMFSVTADKTQEDIWKVRGDVMDMNCIEDCNIGMLQMGNDNLRNTIEENENIINEINLLEKKIEQSQKTKEATTKERHDTEFQPWQNLQTGPGERYVVLPKIHRRRDPNEAQKKDAKARTGPVIKMKKVEPLPAIGKKATHSEACQTSNTESARKDSIYNADSPIAPKPPPVEKSAQNYTRKNILQRLKAFITE